jgi:hypothetical protein
MKEVYSRLFVGGDSDYEKVKDKSDWYVVRACKEGPGGHRDQLGYTERAAPKDKNYLFVQKPRLLAVNLVDSDSPDYVPNSLVDKVLAFVSDSLGLGHKVLIACNSGVSRAPSLAMIWMALNGKLPFDGTVRKFKQLYPDYSPAPGIKIYSKQRIAARR